MIDWDEIVQAQDDDELKKVKIFLFKENMRLDAEKRNLEEERRRIEQMQEDFIKDRVKLRDELDELNRRTLQERQRLKQESMFFEKKMEILKDGFRSLEEDRRKLEQERRNLEESRLLGQGFEDASPESLEEVAEFLFRGVVGSVALRKRYKDLVKIFHPDNLCGDAQMAQAINRVFQRRWNEL
ncbi:MAG: hypothetical protein K5891_09180 [Lachnospiraceae bacterium]|nr:hypothetical protein [Lachnospiraceae bacterium]